MGFGPNLQQAWCTAIPNVALKHEFVVHGVLALAALHVATSVDSPEMKKSYQNLVALELHAGLKPYMMEVRHVSSENVEALFAFSTIISVFNTYQANTKVQQLVLSRQVDAMHHASQETVAAAAVQAALQWLRTLRGAQIILVPGWSTLQSGPLRPVITRETWSAAISISDAHRADERRLKILESMWSSPRRQYQDYFGTLHQAWQELRRSFALVWKLVDEAPSGSHISGPTFDWTAVFHFAVQCSLEFAALLEEQCIEAWILMGHYALLGAEVKGLWWFDGSAESCLATAALVIGTNNWEWIAYPAAKIGLDLESLRLFALDRPKIVP